MNFVEKRLKIMHNHQHNSTTRQCVLKQGLQNEYIMFKSSSRLIINISLDTYFETHILKNSKVFYLALLQYSFDFYIVNTIH